MLVVDDDPAVLGQVQVCIEHAAELCVALNAHDALRLARRWQPDLMLVDWHLGETDGLALLRMLRADAALAAMPVLFISADASARGQAQALGLGALDFLAKPLDPALLADRVRSALRSAVPEPGLAPGEEMLPLVMHEIANPLSGLSGLCGLLLQPGSDPLSMRQRRLVTLMSETTDDLRRLLADLLDLARARAGHFSVQLGAVALGPLLESVSGLLRLQALEGGVVLHVAPTPGLCVQADAVRLRQCLMNLVGNGFKYGRGRVEVLAGVDGDRVRIDVRDNGAGLSPAALARLGQPFERHGQHAQPGHGLGLAVTRLLAEAMGGALEIRSQPGQGSCFTLVLPLAAPGVRQ